MNTKDKIIENLMRKYEKLKKEYMNHFSCSLDCCIGFGPHEFDEDDIKSIEKACFFIQDMIDKNVDAGVYEYPEGAFYKLKYGINY